MKKIIPSVRLDSKESMTPVVETGCDCIAIRAQDFLKKGSGQLNSQFYRVKAAGGLRKAFNFNGEIVLSFVMRDHLLRILDVPIACDLLDGLKPDAWTTWDCETYEREHEYAVHQILESTKKTIQLMKLFPECKPIGHVKGSNRNQIISHYRFLHSLGIRTFMLHSADFFRQGNENHIQRLKNYASLIKKEDNVVLLHGFGSQKRLEEFSFLDGYITYSHVVNAQNGKIFVQRKRHRKLGLNLTKTGFIQASTNNLKQMLANLRDSHFQTKLFSGGKKWVAEAEAHELAIQKR